MLRVATYNVHDCIGRDGLYQPQRIAAIVAALDADVVALQEVTLDHAGDVVGLLSAETAMQAIDGTLFERGIGRYGNLLLSRCRVIAQQLHDLPCTEREARGVIQVTIATDAGECTLLATHLGLPWRERRMQIARLADLSRGMPDPLILMGDFNSWLGDCAFRELRRKGFEWISVRSFPTRPGPLLALDRILARKPAHIKSCRRAGLAWVDIASDHFPIKAQVDLAFERTYNQHSGTSPQGASRQLQPSRTVETVGSW
jgi:endonuclease/exonuclease/phosphatase family metal-dependent hydrolase